MSEKNSIQKLVEGFKRFFEKHHIDGKYRFHSMATKQSPSTLIISCCDSRDDPAIITDAKPGEIFVMRNVANLVPKYKPQWGVKQGTSTAIEYAVKHLKVESIIVLGHSNCGGIQALVDSSIQETSKEFSFTSDWINIAKEVKEKMPRSLEKEEQYHFCEKEAIKLSLRNLETFPWVNEAIEAEKLELHGWYFQLDTGRLYILNKDDMQFYRLEM